MHIHSATLFQSTPSVWRATLGTPSLSGFASDFNPRPPCGGRLLKPCKCVKFHDISIHALRVEGDVNRFRRTRQESSYFNPRPPCGGRLSAGNNRPSRDNFNPRPPCGGRLLIRPLDARAGHYFNPRPPCGGRLSEASMCPVSRLFQSTPSVWRATRS